MSEPERPSNREKGADNLSRLKQWLDAVTKIPDRNGTANISAIAVASGVDRQVLYRPEAREMITQAVAEKGLGMPDQPRPGTEGDVPAWALRRIHELEQQLTVARVENQDLRRRLRSYEALDRHLAETGMLPR